MRLIPHSKNDWKIKKGEKVEDTAGWYDTETWDGG